MKTNKIICKDLGADYTRKFNALHRECPHHSLVCTESTTRTFGSVTVTATSIIWYFYPKSGGIVRNIFIAYEEKH